MAEVHLITYDDPATLPQITCEDTWEEGTVLGVPYKTKGVPKCRASMLRNSYYLRVYGPDVPGLIEAAKRCLQEAVALGVIAGVTVGIEGGTEAGLKAAEAAAWAYVEPCIKREVNLATFMMVEREGRWT